MDVERLAGIPLIDDLDPRQRASLAVVLREQSYLPDEAVFAQGDKAWSCYLILDGTVEVEVEGQARTRQVATLGVGELFGEVALLDGGLRSAGCRAGPEGCALAELRRPEFDLIFNAGNSFAYRLMDLIAAQLVRRLRQATEQLRQAAVEEG